MEKVIAKLEKYVLYALVFVFPIIVLSISPNPFVVPKLAILFFGIALLLLIKSLKTISLGKLDLSVGHFDLPVFLIAASFLLSALLRTPNKMEAWLLPGTAAAVILGAFLYFLINQHKEEEKHVVSTVLFGSGVVFSVLTLLSFSQILSKIPQLPAYVRGQGFTPEGGYFPAVIFLLALLPVGVGLFLAQKDMAKKVLTGVCVGLTTLALAVSLYNILPGRPFAPRFPSLSDSWSISVDSLKESPIFGIGPGNYLSAFSRYRPLGYNQTDLWAIKFSTSRNFYLTVLTETGMLGAAGFILLLVSLYNFVTKDVREKKLVGWGFAGTAQMFSLALVAVAFALVPATILLIVVFFIFLAINTKTKNTSLNLTTQGEVAHNLSGQAASKLPSLLLTVPVIVIVGILSFRVAVVLAAEYNFTQSLNLLAKNNAAGTYDTMRQAISLNPLVDRYHAAFAQVNLALANAIASKATQNAAGAQPAGGQAAQLTDQDRSNISLLIQQSINEGKAAVALNPNRSGNWEILGQIYRSIMPLAQGADQFALQTYRQAVALDPINPNLRVTLGGLYYSLKDYDNAINVFQLAGSAKPDLANSHYNLAFAYREKGQLDNAIAEMTLVVSLIKDRNSQDYKVAQQALEDMQAKKKAAQGESGTELNAPQTAKKVVEPPINLPEGTQPPQTPVSPTPVQVSPTPAS
jgi:tetratricopeptide (TPR) repeat protein